MKNSVWPQSGECGSLGAIELASNKSSRAEGPLFKPGRCRRSDLEKKPINSSVASVFGFVDSVGEGFVENRLALAGGSFEAGLPDAGSFRDCPLSLLTSKWMVYGRNLIIQSTKYLLSN